MRCREFVLLVLGAVLFASGAIAQTTFEWPVSDSTTIARYTSFDNCRILTWRMRADAIVQERLASGIAWDTMPYVLLPREVSQGDNDLPAPSSLAKVEQAAQRCMAPFSVVDSVALDRFRDYFEMYLVAGWDTKAQELVDRRMAHADSSEIRAVFDTLLDLGTGPGFALWGPGRRGSGSVTAWFGLSRWNALFEPILARHVAKEHDLMRRVLLYLTLLPQWEGGLLTGRLDYGSWRQSAPIEDSVGAVQRTARVVKFIQSTLTAEGQRRELEDSLRKGWLGLREDEHLDTWMRVIVDLDSIKARFKVNRDLDSLRKSTAAYLAGFDNLNPGPAIGLTLDGKDTTFKETSRELNSVIGQRAVPVHADAWAWGGGDSTGPRPTSGRVSLLVFFDGDGGITSGSYCFSGGAMDDSNAGLAIRRNCAEEMIALRRLADRFPSVEITIVAPAHGYFKYLKPTTPAQEAELIRQVAVSYGISAPVGVVNLPPHWLPDPDGRRVDQLRSADVNWQNYIREVNPAIARKWQADLPAIFKRKRKEELPHLYDCRIVLVDQGGIIIDLAGLNRQSAGSMARQIEALFGRRSNTP